MTDVYLQLDYRAYKHLERQLLNWQDIETTHVSMDQRYYHKALRLEIGDITLEIQGPAVREAVQVDPELEEARQVWAELKQEQQARKGGDPALCACIGTCERCAA